MWYSCLWPKTPTKQKFIFHSCAHERTNQLGNSRQTNNECPPGWVDRWDGEMLEMKWFEHIRTDTDALLLWFDSWNGRSTIAIPLEHWNVERLFGSRLAPLHMLSMIMISIRCELCFQTAQQNHIHIDSCVWVCEETISAIVYPARRSKSIWPYIHTPLTIPLLAYTRSDDGGDLQMKKKQQHFIRHSPYLTPFDTKKHKEPANILVEKRNT